MFCRKCGTKLEDDDLFCSKCGAKVVSSSDEKKEDKGIEVPEETTEAEAKPEEEGPKLSKPELLSKLEKLRNVLKQLEELKTESSASVSSASNEQRHQPAQYSFIRFYWPFFIAAGITFVVVYLLFIIIAFASDDYDFAVIAPVLGMIFGLIGVAIVLIAGAKVAKDKQESANAVSASWAQKEESRRRDRVLSKEDGAKKRNLLHQKAELSFLVPKNCMTSDRVSGIIRCIKFKGAEDVASAVKMLGIK